MNKRKGISLITLIITIVVLIILSGGVILVLNKTGVISSSKETKFKTDLKSYDEEIRMSIGSEYTHDSSIVKRVITQKEEIEKYCKDLVNSEYIEYAYISEGVLTLRGNKITATQRKWAEEAKIKIDDGEEIVVSNSEVITKLSETNWTKNDVTLTIEGLKDKSIKLHSTPYSFDNGENWGTENSKTYNQNTLGIFVKVKDKNDDIYIGQKIDIENIDKISPTEPKEINVVSGLNTLIVMASGSTDSLSGMLGYKYSIDGYTWTDTVLENNTYTFDGISPGTNVTIYAKSVDKVGNESAEIKQINASTISQNSNITISLSTNEWTRGPISATISCDNIPINYVLQYKLEGDKEYTNGSIIPEISDNTKIYARLYYEAIGSQIANTQKVITNIDTIAPSKPSGITIEESSVNTITVKAYGSVDNESGLYGYQYSLNGANWSNTVLEGNTYTFDSIKSATVKNIYARAVDNVGNISSSSLPVPTSTLTVTNKVSIAVEYISGISVYNNWTKKLNVRFTYDSILTGYVLQYKLSGQTEFTTIENNGTIPVLENTTITARLYNSILDDEIATNTKDITIIDNMSPSTPTDIKVVSQNATSLVVKASGSIDLGVGLKGYQYSINGTSWSSTIESGTNYTISELTEGTNYTVYARGVDYLDNISNIYTGPTTRTLYTYTVSYNSNTTDSVSNMPSNQTKVEGIALTLSATTPTRSGYRFDGWATTSSGSVVYSPGHTYTQNISLNLYAIWTLVHTHTSSCYHYHSSSCYTTQSTGHTHTSSCYTQQSTGHTHSSSCYTASHTHTSSCYTAGHTHTSSCYTTKTVMNSAAYSTPCTSINGSHQGSGDGTCAYCGMTLWYKEKTLTCTKSTASKLTCTKSTASVLTCGKSEYTSVLSCGKSETTSVLICSYSNGALICGYQ